MLILGVSGNFDNGLRDGKSGEPGRILQKTVIHYRGHISFKL